MTQTAKTVFEHLGNVKGLGPKTIKKLQTAELDSAKKIEDVGLQGLAVIGINTATAKIILDNLPETPESVETAPATETTSSAEGVRPKAKKDQKPQKAAESETVMGAALKAAMAKNGTTIEAAKAALPKAEKPRKGEKAPAKPKGDKAKGPKRNKEIDVGLTEVVTITNPVQVKTIFPKFERFGYRLPDDAASVKNVTFVAGTGDEVALMEAWVIKVSMKKRTQLVIVHRSLLEQTMRTLASNFEGAEISKMFLSSAIDKLFSAWRRQIEEERKAEALAAQQAKLERIIPDLVAGVLSDPTAEDSPWLSEEEIGKYDHPLQVQIFSNNLPEEVREALGLNVDQPTLERFERNWEVLIAEYQTLLGRNAHRLQAVTDSFALVSDAFQAAHAAHKQPYLPYSELRVFVRPLKAWRFLVVHDSLVQPLIEEIKAQHGAEVKSAIYIRNFLTRRWLVQPEKVVAEADKGFRESDEAKAVMALFSEKLSADEAADAELL